MSGLGRSATYPEIGHAAFGAAGWFASWIGVVFMTVGVCTAYFVFVANTAVDLLAGGHPFFTRGRTILMLLPVFVLLSWGPYKYLSHFSVIGITALVFGLAVVMYDAFTYNSIAPLSTYEAFSWGTYPLFLGNTAFVFLIHSVVLPMRNQMSKPRFCPYTLAVAIVLVTVLNLLFAVPVYLSYGPATMGNIILNLHEGPLKTSVQVALCVDLFFTYALFLFPMCEALENDIRRLRGGDRHPNQPNLRGLSVSGDGGGGVKGGAQGEELPWAFRAGLRAGLVAATALLCYLVEDFSAMSALSGGFGNNLVGFILPPLFITSMKHKGGWWEENGVGGKLKWAEIGFNGMVSAGGVALLVSSIKTFVKNL
ncbi:hypothetical protein TrRE_jg3042 [Triparma retinervis]|uniref:Amino acid transporter transmembrane domain-containing protein n=1 Tax=Triparma retinervis TaxID=2557542 RepID=A0A9W7DR30_9STRA|nr:hypothetical protein TrRE_jg3042 [Triparma retinervis]